MNLLTIFLVFVVLLSIFVFILLFGQSPQFRHGVLGKLNWILIAWLPRNISRLAHRVLGRTVVNKIYGAWFYCCESRNPFLQIFFISLSGASILLFLKFALPHIPNIYLSSMHRFVLIPGHICWLYISYYIICTADPGTITADNVQQYLDHYAYDYILYEPKQCRTCRLKKPARSKHCSMCKGCIGRLDHHCAWINRCVGHNNQRYFFLFLFSLSEFCIYGTYLCFQIYRSMIIETGLDQAMILDSATGAPKRISFRKAMIVILQRDRIIGSIGILAMVVAVVVFGFLIYQLYLTAQGLTTNEAIKWEILEDAMDCGEIVILAEDAPKPTPMDNKSRRRKAASPRSVSSTAAHSHDVLKPRKIYVDDLSKVEGRNLRFEELENIYDHGMMQNLWNVFFPKSL
ncbi:DHHC palmitoyltransferase-domain-containing protein [Radiomyces spectabilis]|uniref:DHHC palmitoyltransferase-domain-containing protein n=1 Tax=Radiomyces spectabilis TaxID=64574 RepID=UPI0022204D2A|nr:DHHC palmitoyltransferase-domain-containing protein [Radiomyces spectabilis]KAI8391478.1 DHHC palmitoyltransferase-domain-containing protein [Radiomyces spectabilis]